MCSDQRSCARLWRWRRADSRRVRFSCQVLCGRYLSRMIGIMSLMGRPKRQDAGDCLVEGSGELRYWRIARWKVLTLRSLLVPTFPEISRLIVLTATSARQLLCGKATELSLWCTRQLLKNRWVSWAVNSGPPSDASSSGMPNVEKVWRRTSISPFEPLVDRSTIGQLVYRSTKTKYWWPL